MKISSILVHTLIFGLAFGASFGVHANLALASTASQDSELPPPPPPPPIVEVDEPEEGEDNPEPAAVEQVENPAPANVHEPVLAPVIRKPQKKRSSLDTQPQKSQPALKEVLYLEETSNPLGDGFFWSGLALTLAGGGAITWAMVDQRQKLHDGVVRPGYQNDNYLKQAQALVLGGEIAVITGSVLMTLGTVFWLTDVGETTSRVLPDQVWVFPGSDTMFAGVGYDF